MENTNQGANTNAASPQQNDSGNQNQQFNNQQQAAQTQPPVQQQPLQAQPQQNLPDDTQQRTREQFEKLIDANKRLNEQNQQYEQQLQAAPSQQQLPANQQIPQPQIQHSQQSQVDPNDYVEVNPVTGERYINEEKLQSRISELTQAANESKKMVQQYIERTEKQNQVRQRQEAFRNYPELNPEANGYDTDFSRRVRATLQDSMFNSDDYGGRSLSFREAADYVKKGVLPTTQPGNGSGDAQPAQQQQQQQNQEPTAQELKEQANAQANSQPAQVRNNLSDENDLQNMQMKTRLGNDEALAQRLLHTPHINPNPGLSPSGSDRGEV